MLPGEVPFWSALQIHHFVRYLQGKSSYMRTTTQFEDLCLDLEPPRHALSQTHCWLSAPEADYFPPYTQQWERELGTSWTKDQKSRIILMSHKAHMACAAQETSFKLTSRWYRVPVSLNKIFPEVPKCCWRCGGSQGTFVHVFWDCPVLRPFWNKVVSIAERVTGVRPLNSPAACLLHLAPMSIKSYKGSLLAHLLTAAKTAIAALWRQNVPPSLAAWANRVNETRHMEDLTSTIKRTQEKFTQTWLPWLDYLSSPEAVSLV